MSLIYIDTIADDDGDEICIEADDQAVYLTVNREFDGPGPEFEDHECPQRCVALSGDQLDRFSAAWVAAVQHVEAMQNGEGK